MTTFTPTKIEVEAAALEILRGASPRLSIDNSRAIAKAALIAAEKAKSVTSRKSVNTND